MTRKSFIKALRDESARLMNAADALETLPRIALELSDEVIALSPNAFRDAVKNSLREVNGNKVVSLNDLSENLFGRPLEVDPDDFSNLDLPQAAG